MNFRQEHLFYEKPSDDFWNLYDQFDAPLLSEKDYDLLN